MNSLHDLLGVPGYRRVLALLSDSLDDMLDSDIRHINSDIIVAATPEMVLVSGRVCIWRFGPDDAITHDTAIIPINVILEIAAGQPWAADWVTMPGGKPADITSRNPVAEMWDRVITEATTPLVDTGVVAVEDHGWLPPRYLHLFDLHGAALVIDERMIGPLRGIGSERVSYLASAVDAAILALVDHIPIAVVMPCVANVNDPEALDRWGWFARMLDALRDVAVAS